MKSKKVANAWAFVWNGLIMRAAQDQAMHRPDFRWFVEDAEGQLGNLAMREGLRPAHRLLSAQARSTEDGSRDLMPHVNGR
ncbi:MAG: hypothetical protein E4H19_05325 [Chromatiales bacterium]|nr:MAG: hypothetical protein E4H19_05325 [Chromatiales bacterium]